MPPAKQMQYRAIQGGEKLSLIPPEAHLALKFAIKFFQASGSRDAMTEARRAITDLPAEAIWRLK